MNQLPAVAARTSEADFDVSKRFVRVLQERRNGFIEFEFAIGSPELCVELMLPRAAFAAFCQEQKPLMLGPHPAQAEEEDPEF